MSSPSAAILEQIPEATVGQPGWNSMARKMLARVNAIPEIALDALAQKIIQGPGMTISYNAVSRNFTFSSAAGVGGLDEEAVMDLIAAHLTINALTGTYDDPAGNLNFTVAGGGGSYTDEQAQDAVLNAIKQGWGVKGTHDDVNNAFNLENRAFGSVPAEHGVEMWTCHPDQASNSTAPTTGVIYLMRFRAHADDTINNIYNRFNSTPTSPTACFMGIYNLAGTRLGLTADRATSWATSGEKTNPLTAGVAVTKDTDYVGAVLVGGGTPGTMTRAGASSMSNFGMALPAFRVGTFGTGLTALPATIDFTQVVNSTGLNQFWMGFSS